MARMARVVVPHYPHHVIQRGNRRQQTFFGERDYSSYLEVLSESCSKAGTRVWAYCLMPNHVHLVLVPSHADGLRAALGEAHRRYTRSTFVSDGADTCGRGAFSRFPWTRNTCSPQRVTWNETRSPRGFASAPKTGRGPVRQRTCGDATTSSSRFHRCCRWSATGAHIWLTPETAASSARSPGIPAPAALSGTRNSSARSKTLRAACWHRAGRGVREGSAGNRIPSPELPTRASSSCLPRP